jgi:Arc-like DNA binding domain.
MASDDSATNSQTAEKFVVRLPRGMRRRIADAARAYHRSMNSEIVARLEHSLDSGGETYPDPVERAADAAAPAAESGSAEEVALVDAFRRMTPERRRALLALIG